MQIFGAPPGENEVTRRPFWLALALQAAGFFSFRLAPALILALRLTLVLVQDLVATIAL